MNQRQVFFLIKCRIYEISIHPMGENLLRKIMHIDDEEDVRSIAQLALCDIGGFQICSCSSGREALEKVAIFEPDLFLVDSMMPDMSGEELVKRLRMIAGCESVPVVFLTAVGHVEAMNRFRELKPVAIILKPFDPISLHDELQDAWAVAQSGAFQN